MLYDDILKKIGEFGPNQKRIFAILCWQPFTSGMITLMTIFTMATPPHRCAIPEYPNDTYQAQSEYHSHLINESIPKASSCLLRNISGQADGNVASSVYKCNSWVYDTSIFTSTFVTEFNMVCDEAVLESNAVMAFFLGALSGCIVLSNIADIFGRKPLLVVCNYVFVTSAFLLVWTPSYMFLLIVQFTMGVGFAGQYLATFIIGLEIVGPAQRKYTGILGNCTWCAGMFLISFLAYLIREWRYLQLAVAILSTHLLFFIFLIPESPRWLLTRGYTNRARYLITKAAQENKKNLNEAMIGTMAVPGVVYKVKFWHLCSSWRLAKRTFSIYFMWFAVSIIYYGIMLNLDILVGDVYLNLFLTSFLEVFCYLVVLWTVDYLGRKKLMCGCFLLMATSLVAVITILLHAPPDQKWLMTLFTLIGQSGIICAFAVVWLWTGELSPTDLRNVGIGTGSAAARVGSLVAPYLKLISTLIPGSFRECSPFILYFIVCITALVFVYFFLPETSHTKLPDTVDDSARLGERTDETRESLV